jgi:hypothetical protein
MIFFFISVYAGGVQLTKGVLHCMHARCPKCCGVTKSSRKVCWNNGENNSVETHLSIPNHVGTDQGVPGIFRQGGARTS